MLLRMVTEVEEATKGIYFPLIAVKHLMLEDSVNAP